MLYDALELSFNMANTTSISNINNVDILESLNLKATASTVYTKGEINANDTMYANAFNSNADKPTRYTKT